MTNRTPIPWFIDQYGSVYKKEGSSNDRVILEGFGLNCSFDKEARDNTEFVVRACNNHDKLVQLLKDAAYCLRSAYGNSTAEEIRMDEMAAKIDAALILAEKK